MSNDTLLCDNVTFWREDQLIFSDISLQLQRGDMAHIQGANGAGKSTFIKILAGIINANSGNIYWEGKNIKESSEYYNKLLYVGHKLGVSLDHSVKENVSHWASLHDNTETIAAAIHYFELEPYLDMPCSMLSAGWLKRVALTRIITIPAILWLLDEPFANLDADGSALVESLMVSRREQGGIIIFTAHEKIDNDSIKSLTINSLN